MLNALGPFWLTSWEKKKREDSTLYRRNEKKRRSSPLAHIAEHQLETVAQGVHIGVRVLLEFEALWDDLDGPVLESRMLACLEAKEEVAGVFGVDAEGISRATRIGLGVGLKPLIWE